MKKLAALIFIVFLFLLGALRVPRVLAANNCDWSMDNGVLKFCSSGDTEQQLRNTRIEFQCTSNCSGPLNFISQGHGVQSVDMQNAQIDPKLGIFACGGGNIDQSLIEAVRTNIQLQSNACGGIGLVPGVVTTIATGGLSAVAHIAATVAGAAGGLSISAPCLDAVNRFRPTIQARLVDKTTGNVLCSKDLTMNVDVNRQVTAAGGSPGGLKAGTNIQSGIGLEFCTPTAGGQGITTALGCIPTDPSKFIGFLLTIGIGIAGGIAFLLILFGGFQILTSAGNPEQLNAGRELVSSAIAGLLLIIFSVFILRIIGVNILGIPEFQ